MEEKQIVHIDQDAFFVSVEVLKNSELGRYAGDYWRKFRSRGGCLLQL